MTSESETPSNEALKKGIHRDVLGSAVIGPFRVAIPIVGYLFLVPFIQQTAGLAVLGIWAQMRSLYELLSMGDVGFSIMLSREAGRDRSPEEREAAKRDFNASVRFFFTLLIAFQVLIFTFGGWVMNEGLDWDAHYNADALLYSLSIFVTAVIVQMISMLYTSILAARNDAIFVNAVAGFMPLFPIIGTAVGVDMGYVLEGFAIGALIGSIVRVVVYRSRVVVKHGEWHNTPGHLPLRETYSHIADFMKRSWRFYSLTIGTILNEPVFRYTMGVVIGAEAVGIYAIAHHVISAIRMFITAGLNTLMPGLAVFHRTNQRAEAIQLMRMSEILLIAAASLLYGAVILGGDYLYALWLKPEHVPEGIAIVTFYIAFWYLITTHNVPFWRYMQASGNEGAIASCLWLHTGGILLLIPASNFVNFTIEGMLIWWMAFGLLSQAFFFTTTERRLNCVIETVRHPSLLTLLPALWAFMFVGLGFSLFYGSSFPAPSIVIDWERFAVAALLFAAYGAVVAWVLFPYGKDLVERFRARKARA